MNFASPREKVQITGPGPLPQQKLAMAAVIASGTNVMDIVIYLGSGLS